MFRLRTAAAVLGRYDDISSCEQVADLCTLPEARLLRMICGITCHLSKTCGGSRLGRGPARVAKDRFLQVKHVKHGFREEGFGRMQHCGCRGPGHGGFAIRTFLDCSLVMLVVFVGRTGPWILFLFGCVCR